VQRAAIRGGLHGARVEMRTGRQVAEIELSGDVAGILEGYTKRRKTAQVVALRARIGLGCASGLSNKEGGDARAGERANGWQVAAALRRARPRRTARRAAAGGAAQDRRCQGRERHRADAGEPAIRSHALEPAQHGTSQRHLDLERGTHLAVNAGEKMHSGAGVKMHQGRGQAAPRRTLLSSSIA